MVPRTSQLGRSFKSCGLYYLHDKDASTSERVVFTHVENCPTQNPEKALKWMAFTAIHAEELKRDNGSSETGQRCHKPVFTFSLAWHPEQEPQKWEMIGAGRRALIALGLAEHETVMVAHGDTDHAHLHLIVNTVHPETGKVNNLSYSRLKLSKWAEEYEREHGKIYCKKRVENNEEREQGKFVKYEEPGIDHKARIAELYHASDSGKAFQEALSQAGYKLAQGRRIVVIDQQGTVYSLSRQLDSVNAKDMRAKLADVVLPRIDETGKGTEQKDSSVPESKESGKKKSTPEETGPSNSDPDYVDREEQDRQWQESIIEAGIAADAGTNRKTDKPKPSPAGFVAPHLFNRLQDSQLAELGHFYERNSQARHRLAARMETQHGAHERQLRAEASHLQSILNNSGPVRKWWLRFTGQISKNPEEQLQNMHRTLENIEWRRKEAQQAIEAEIARERREIEERHLHERLELKPINPPTGQLALAKANGPEEDLGPSLGY